MPALPAAPQTGATDGAGAGCLTLVEDSLAPLLEVLPLQRLALEAARRRGLDPDRPAGLRKVT